MNRGYTLIELMVVIAISGLIAMIVFFGIRSFGNSQAVTNAQLEFASNLRSLQTQVYNGSQGLNNQYIRLQNNQASYGVYDNNNTLLRTVTLPAKVKLPAGYPLYLAICLANPNLASYGSVPGINQCYQCSSGVYFACQSDGTSFTQVGSTPTTIQIGFTNGTITKYVNVVGSGMTISQIYKAP